MIARTNRTLRIMRFLYIFLFLAITLNLQAQVTGVVKDTAGEPIPGANVFLVVKLLRAHEGCLGTIRR